MKQCKQCGTDFSPVHERRGHEQLYCSKKCGQISARIRREQRLKNAVNEKQIIHEQPTTTNQSTNMAQQPMGGIITNGGGNSLNDISYLEKLYEAKNENNYLKLKCENLEEKIKALQFEINELNNEIEAMEIDEEVGEQQGILGNVMQQFKSDPINTINFAKAMMSEMFNPKKEKSNA
jgi:hypothetical protein